jgi:hypothetical protein
VINITNTAKRGTKNPKGIPSPKLQNNIEAGINKSIGVRLEYKGFYKTINEKPEGECINLFVSDWNKEHFAFYVYIGKDNYSDDIEQIQKLITKLNYRDGDVYCELIDHSPELEHFYHYLYELGHYTQSDVLDPEYWEILKEKGDEHFLYFNKLIGSTAKDDLRDAEFSVYNDWYEVLETFNPDLYKALDESNGLGCFDIEHFYNCSGFHEIGDVIVCE